MNLNNTFLNRIFGYFVRGLILVAPLYFTILIIWTGVETMDGILPISIPISQNKSIYLPGLGMLITAFVGDKKKFNQPVLVTINRESDIKKLGFITQTDLSHLEIKDYIAVYMPHSYAFSGELFIVPIANVTLLNATSTDIMKMIVSGGVSAKGQMQEEV